MTFRMQGTLVPGCRMCRKKDAWYSAVTNRAAYTHTKNTHSSGFANRLCYTFLDWKPFRFGRPGVECYCQHESGAAVIQLQFLINEVGKLDTTSHRLITPR